jgi:hypothetical protein
MKTISKPVDNMGGLTKLWAIPYNVYSLSGKTISIADSSNVYEIYCTPESMDFSEQKERSDAGNHYKTEVSGFIPGDSEATLAAIEYIEPRRWVIVFKDGNGRYKAAGSQFEPLRTNPDLSLGKDTVGRAGYSFSFSEKTTSRAQFVNYPF